MKKLRRVVTVAAFVGLSGISVAAAVRVARTRLPAPETSEAEQIQQWLATRDVRDSSPAVQERLMERLQHELARGEGWRLDDSLKAEEWLRLTNNLRVLVEQWLVRQAKAYHALPEEGREAFLRARQAEIARWYRVLHREMSRRMRVGDLEGLLDKEPGAAEIRAAVRTVQSWVSDLPHEEWRLVTEFTAALEEQALQERGLRAEE